MKDKRGTIHKKFPGGQFKARRMLEIRNISKKYKKGSDEFIALDNVSLEVEKGDYVVVTGASGAGKSTLLNAIGGLIHPDSGEVLYNGKNIYSQGEKTVDNYRKSEIGFMFQQFHLMPYLTVLENIKIACNNKKQFGSAENYLEKCALSVLKNKYPSELSVGEKQRSAFIRAIISDPSVLLADEPTGNLDPENSRILMSLIGDYHKRGGTVILVSHDPIAAEYANRTVLMDKGRRKL
jgi:ABC-type lipoprotein export system ATPase subunit